MSTVYTTPEKYLYRCAFPRGRVLSQLEDDLTIFTQLIVKYAHKHKEEFDALFDKEYQRYNSLTEKTIHNHRTEMIKLYGLTFTSEDGLIEPTLRTTQLLDTQDFHQFFKLFCLKFQFPNCINKPQSTIEQINKHILFKPAQYILKLYLLGFERFGKSFAMSGNEVSNLIFNDLRVTTGAMSPEECFSILMSNRENHLIYEAGSKLNQHGREFLGYMKLANLLTSDADDNGLYLNSSEMGFINKIINDKSFFVIDSRYATSAEDRKEIAKQWDEWYGSVSDEQISHSKTTAESIQVIEARLVETIPDAQAKPVVTTYKDIGDLGEKLVLKYEKDIIGKIRPDKVGLVQKVSNDTVLGFDIQSFEFSDLTRKKYIEVKTTNRTYPPDMDILTSFPMSSNEWETARNYKDAYYIYRVFLLGKAIKMFVVKNPVNEEKKGNIILEPHEYRVILRRDSGLFTD